VATCVDLKAVASGEWPFGWAQGKRVTSAGRMGRECPGGVTECRAAVLPSDCGLVDHATILVEGKRGVKHALLWTSKDQVIPTLNSRE